MNSCYFPLMFIAKSKWAPKKRTFSSPEAVFHGNYKGITNDYTELVMKRIGINHFCEDSRHMSNAISFDQGCTVIKELRGHPKKVFRKRELPEG